jgi:hypothetical protein
VQRDAVRFEFFVDDDHGRDPWISNYDRSLAPGASARVVIRTPVLGSTVQLVTSSEELRAYAEVIRDGGTFPEPREPMPCAFPSRPLRSARP